METPGTTISLTAPCGRFGAGERIMKSYLLAGLGILAATATPAQAQDRQGSIQVKLLATGVLPDGKIKSVETDIVGLPANTQTRANDNYVPTVAI